MSKARKYVYSFGALKNEGDASMVNLLGGKGANLAEMSKIGIPVPPGFSITTDCCNDFFEAGMRPPKRLSVQVDEALKLIEEETGMGFGYSKNPLLVSCRSGARRSMPGMMETVLNVGLCSRTIPGLIEKSKNERFVYDAYRRLITMYSDVVMEKAEGIEPKDDRGIRKQLEAIMDDVKAKKKYKQDTDLTAEDLKYLCVQYKRKIKEVLGKPFPDDAMEQLWGGIGAVFKSWNGKRAVSYRNIEGIPHAWGTATNVQAMVFGNMGDTSATGVAFSRNPATGEHKFFGEWLPNAQGEDVVAGIRTPNPINESTKSDKNRSKPSLEKAMPRLYKELDAIQKKLEHHYHDMQDIEFTIQDGKLYMLQCRNGKRTGQAAVKMALDMLNEKLIDEKTVVMRVQPNQISEVVLPILSSADEKKCPVYASGLPAGPGGACGRVVFTAADAVKMSKDLKHGKVILVREETNPEDVEGMRAADGILTARGGMTSHAALVARGWGKCCIVGAGEIHVDAKGGKMVASGKVIKKGDWIALNGSRGLVYAGQVSVIKVDIKNPKSAEEKELAVMFVKMMAIADKYRTIGVRTNADTPADAAVARSFGAEGIGLFRTEHMFYGEGSDKPLFLLRKMILSTTEAERRKALSELFVHVKHDIKATLVAMEGLPVTIRLLDPPLHEFVPQDPKKQAELAAALGITIGDIERRGKELHENNPMMGHRGVRLGITYPEVTEMQVRAILEAAAEIIKSGKKCKPEIMIPVTCDVNELKHQKNLCKKVYAEVCKHTGVAEIPHMYGTMIEIPRAALLADRMAEDAEFFSFGTNDLSQMTFGFSRDDIGGFLPDYLEQHVIPADPFQTIDQDGVGQLIDMAVKKGRSTRRDLKVGICGEQGGDPASVEFCFKTGLNYVSCSPYRVPIAKLAAAQAALKAAKK